MAVSSALATPRRRQSMLTAVLHRYAHFCRQGSVGWRGVAWQVAICARRMLAAAAAPSPGRTHNASRWHARCSQLVNGAHGAPHLWRRERERLGACALVEADLCNTNQHALLRQGVLRLHLLPL